MPFPSVRQAAGIRLIGGVGDRGGADEGAGVVRLSSAEKPLTEKSIAFCRVSGEIYDLTTYLGLPISSTKELLDELCMIMPVNQFADNLRSALQKENRKRLKTQKMVDPF